MIGRTWVALPAICGVLAATLIGSHPASADPTLDTAAAKAAALSAQVRTLQRQAEVAIEHYDAAQADLGQMVLRHLLAQRRLDALQVAVTERRDTAGARVRALYAGGGELGLYASVLDAGDLTDLSARLVVVGRIVRADRAATDATTRVAAAAGGVERELAALGDEQTRLEQQVAAASGVVLTALTTQEQLLAAANDEVRRLAAQVTTNFIVADGRAFTAMLAGAHGWSGQDGPEGEPTAAGRLALAAAQLKLNTPYLWGGTGPNAFDCSGLTGWAYAAAGIGLPRTAAQQYFSGPHPPLSDLRPGDLLFWASDRRNPSSIHHVAIYAGHGLMISDDHTGDTARLQPVWADEFAGVTRPDPAMAAVVPGPRWHAG